MRGGEFSGHFISPGAGPDETGYPHGPNAIPYAAGNWDDGDPIRPETYTLEGPGLDGHDRLAGPYAVTDEIADGVVANLMRTLRAPAESGPVDPFPYRQPGTVPGIGWIDM